MVGRKALTGLALLVGVASTWAACQSRSAPKTSYNKGSGSGAPRISSSSIFGPGRGRQEWVKSYLQKDASQFPGTVQQTSCPWTNMGATKPFPGGSGYVRTPTGKVVVNDCSFNKVYGTITIPRGSTVIFLDLPITLQVKQIIIEDGGKLLIGSPTCRMTNEIKIQFMGKASEDRGATGQNNGLWVKPGGVLEMHGKQYAPTWSRLAVNVKPNDKYIFIQDRVNWEVGQEIVVATSQYRDDDSPQHNEKLTIAGQSFDSSKKVTTIKLTKAVKYEHYSGTEYQTEVGLLSRKIVVSSASTDGYGGHQLCEGTAKCRWSGVQAIGMGQTNRMARYPFHFHLCGDVTGATHWVHDCSCENSNFRCQVTHGTSGASIAANVAFNTLGHSYYLEDGIEERNNYYYNLAIRTKWILKPASGSEQGGEVVQSSGALVQPTDVSAGGFYAANTNNNWIGCASSGGWTGFAFPLLPKPIGPSQHNPKFKTHKPQDRPLGKFQGNSAHSAGYHWDDPRNDAGAGSCLYSGGTLTEAGGRLTYNTGRKERDTQDDNGKLIWWKMEDVKFWLCKHGINTWGRRLDVERLEMHDSFRMGQFFGQCSIKDALVNGRGKNPVVASSTRFMKNVCGFRTYDTWVGNILSNITFSNFKYQGRETVFQGMTHSDVFKPQFMTALKNIKYINVDSRALFWREYHETGSYRMWQMIDTDGSASLSGPSCRPSIIGAGQWFMRNDCKFDKITSSAVCPRKLGREVVHLQFVAGPPRNAQYNQELHKTGDNPTDKANLETGFIAQAGSGTRRIPLTKNPGVTGLSDAQWFVWWKKGTPAKFMIFPQELPRGVAVIVMVRYKNYRQFTIKAKRRGAGKPRQEMTLKKAASKSDFARNGQGDTWWTEGNILYLKITNMIHQYPYPYDYEREDIRLPGMVSGKWTQDNYDLVYEVSSPGGNDIVSDTVPPEIPGVSVKKCSSVNVLKNQNSNVAGFPYRYTCAVQFPCPGGFNAQGLKQCEWSYDGGKRRAPAGALCNDGNPNTVNDKCSSSGTCKGSPDTGPVVSQGPAAAKTFIDIFIRGDDLVTKVEAICSNPSGTKTMEKKHPGSYQSGSPNWKDIVGKVTIKMYTPGKTYTYVFSDWNSGIGNNGGATPNSNPPTAPNAGPNAVPTWSPKPPTWNPNPPPTWNQPKPVWTQPKPTWTPKPKPTWTPEPKPTWTPVNSGAATLTKCPSGASQWWFCVKCSRSDVKTIVCSSPKVSNKYLANNPKGSTTWSAGGGDFKGKVSCKITLTNGQVSSKTFWKWPVSELADEETEGSTQAALEIPVEHQAFPLGIVVAAVALVAIVGVLALYRRRNTAPLTPGYIEMSEPVCVDE